MTGMPADERLVDGVLYREIWHCPRPEYGQPYQVLSQQWHEERAVDDTWVSEVDIYAWEPL